MEKPITAPLPEVSELIKKSWSFYKQNYKKFLLLSVPLVCLAVVGSIIGLLLQMSNLPNSVGYILVMVGILLSLAVPIFSIVFPIVLIKNIKDAEENSLFDAITLYKSSFKILLPLVWVGILFTLISLGGSILFLIPGIALAGYLGYYHYTVVLDGKRGLEALLASFYYVRGNWWGIFGRLFLLGLVVGGVALILLLIMVVAFMLLKGGFSVENLRTLIVISEAPGGITSGLLNIITAILQYSILYPIFTLFSYFIFKELKTSKTLPDEQGQKKARSWLKAFAILGAFVIPLILASIVLVSLQDARTRAASATQRQMMMENGLEDRLGETQEPSGL